MQFERSDEASNGAAEEGALLGTAAAVYVVDSPTAREIALLRREGGGRREEDATAVRIQRWTLGVSTLLASILVALAAFVFLRRGDLMYLRPRRVPWTCVTRVVGRKKATEARSSGPYSASPTSPFPNVFHDTDALVNLFHSL